MLVGIYMLVFNNTEEIYVGSSKNINLRYSQHCKQLTDYNPCTDSLMIN